MTKGIEGTGFYGRIRTLANALRADRQCLENAPLGPRQKKELQKQINSCAAELKKVRAELRASKEKKS